MPILEARIESFKYFAAQRPSLGKISLDVEPGEFIILTGPAGSGKTTLCYALTGVIPHSIEGTYAGQVKIDGQELNTMRLAQVSRLCGFVLQSPEYQLFNLTVKDDVAFGPENMTLPPGEVLARIAGSLAQVGMQGFDDRNSDLLSGGQMQRVVLACVLAMRTDLLILDQPTAELDPVGRKQIYDHLLQLNRDKGKTIIVADDRLSDVARYASRIVLLEHGEIVHLDEPKAFFADRAVFTSGLRIPAPARLHHYLESHGYPPCPLDLDIAGTAEQYRPLLNGLAREMTAAQPPRPVETVAPAEIQIERLAHVYPTGQTALSEVSLTIGQGEFMAIVGENGAGKTTLAKHLIGLLRPTRGRVLLQGRDIAASSIARLSDQVGYLFQDPDYQIFSNSVYEEVAFALKIRRVPVTEIKGRVMAVLEQLGLSVYADTHPYRLSRGQRQRLALASIFVHSPPILVVDEPSTGLDYAETHDIMRMLADRNRSGATVLIITHDIELVLRYSRRSVVVSGGRIRLDVPTGELHRHLDELDTAGILIPDQFELLKALDLHTHITSVHELGDLILTAQTRAGEGR
ncbi:MAG: ABC transporter ATP-binding protein [Chloroflexi bacterium]|nr:ABC transporter ATP-binding protein [Chloroflexota bacterium]